jgi:uncharacterized protein DUF1259
MQCCPARNATERPRLDGALVRIFWGWEAFIKIGLLATLGALVIREALTVGSRTPLATPGAMPPPAVAQLDQIIGVKGQANGGVYQFAVPRRDPVTENGMQISSVGPMGVAIAIGFQRTGGGKAAITGDFVLSGDEVNPVIRALRANDIDVTAVHSHMLDEQPRLFFLHFWANDDALKLARGLRAALSTKQPAQRAKRTRSSH